MTRRSILAWLAAPFAVAAFTPAVLVSRRIDLAPIKTPTGYDAMGYYVLYGHTPSGYVKLAERWPHEPEWRTTRWHSE